MNYLDLLIIFLAKYLGWALGILAVFIFLKNRRLLLESFLSAAVARFGITDLIRYFYNRPRPFEVGDFTPLISHEYGYSFPSGHAAFFFALSTAIFLYNRRWGAVFFIGAILISLGRVWAGVHWYSDILGGAIVGILTSILVNFLVRKFQRPGSSV